MKDFYLIKTLLEHQNTSKIEVLFLRGNYAVLSIFRKELKGIEEYVFLLSQKDMNILGSLEIDPVTRLIKKFINSDDTIEVLTEE